MKSNKVFSIIVFLILGSTSNVFSMDLKPYERFKEINEIDLGRSGTCKAISPCGKYVVAPFEDDGKVIVMDIENNKKKCYYEHDCSMVNCMRFSNDDRYVASGGIDGKVIVWDIENNKKKCSYEHNESVNCVYFSKDSRYVASGGECGKVIVMDIEDNKEKCSYSHGAWVNCVHFSKDNEKLISFDMNETVIVHKTSCEFFLGQTLYEAKKKQKESFYKKLLKNLKKSRDGRRDLTIICKS